MCPHQFATEEREINSSFELLIYLLNESDSEIPSGRYLNQCKTIAVSAEESATIDSPVDGVLVEDNRQLHDSFRVPAYSVINSGSTSGCSDGSATRILWRLKTNTMMWIWRGR
jgi:hypothetical protein